MSFLFATLNHVRAVQSWAAAHDGNAALDVLTFQLEVKARHRYFTLFPQFVSRANGRLSHVASLSSEVFGFIGWLPYRPLRWPLSTDKLAFKRLLSDAGYRTPRIWPSPTKSEADFVVKQSVGSFGLDMAGPYRRGAAVPPEKIRALGRGGERGEVYTEEFIPGRNVKAWFWGATPFHVQVHDYPQVIGDGARSLRSLATERLSQQGRALDTYKELPFLQQSLSYQGFDFDDVLPAGACAWLDFRYGRRFQPAATGEDEDNSLPLLQEPTRTQLDALGGLLAAELARSIGAPVLYSADGVLDDAGNVWWLEVNSNPIFPPTGYRHMLGTLFGVPASPSAHPAPAPAVAAADRP